MSELLTTLYGLWLFFGPTVAETYFDCLSDENRKNLIAEIRAIIVANTLVNVSGLEKVIQRIANEN